MTTNNSIDSGTGTTGQVLQANTNAAPTYSTATYPSTTTVSQLLYSSAANTVAGLATANSATIATTSAGVPVAVALGAGQSLVGVASGTPAAGSIPGKNMVINGDFQIWQRGAGGSATFSIGANANAYTADRWQCRTITATTTATVTQSAGATSGSFLAKVQRPNGNAGTNAIYFGTSLMRDACIGAAGNVVTLSFKAKAGANYSAASSLLNVTLDSGIGSTDVSDITTGFTGSAPQFSNNITLTSTLTNYSMSSNALASTITQLAAFFVFTPVGSAGADDSFSVTDIQLEISPVQTLYERKSFGEELRLCKRFYQKTFDYAVAPVQNVASNVGAMGGTGSVINLAFGANWILDGLMRTNTPSVTTFSPNGASANWSTNTTTPTATVSQIGGSNVFITGGTSVTAGNIYYIHATAENDVT